MDNEGNAKKNLEAILESPSYRIAFKDHDFLGRDELRPVRFQLELLKPRMAFDENEIESTIVVFGSTRIPAPERVDEIVNKADREATENPNDPQKQQALVIAKRLAARAKYYDEARKFAGLVSTSCQKDGKCNYVVVTGGGPGIMEAANRGAFEVDASSIGLNITLPFEQAPNAYVTPSLCFQFHYFALRKMHFLIRAKAMVAFPGGFGTLDELFETLTLVQTKKMKPIPILLFGKEYWSKLVNFDFMVEEGTISPADLKLFRFVETAEEAWESISTFKW